MNDVPKRRRSRRRDERVAYHEAGHAMAAFLRRRRLTSVTHPSPGSSLDECLTSAGVSAWYHFCPGRAFMTSPG